MADPDATAGDFKPALRFDFLTGLFDPVVALTTRERTFKRLPVFLDELQRDTAGVPPLVERPRVAILEPEYATPT